MSDRDSLPAEAPPAPLTPIDKLTADLLPRRDDLHPVLDEIAQARAKDLSRAATVVICRYRDPVEGLVTRYVLRLHEEDTVDAIVLGSHPRCDCGPLPRAENKHMVVFCQAPEDKPSPRCSLYAVHPDHGFTMPKDLHTIAFTDGDFVLRRSGVAWMVAVGDALVWIFQLRRGQPARRLWTAPGADDPTDYEDLEKEHDVPEKDEFTRAREERLRADRAHDAEEIRMSLFTRSWKQDDPVPTVLFPSVKATLENELTTSRPLGRKRFEVDMWIDPDELYFTVVIGRGSRFCVAPDLLDHFEVSREHAFLFTEDDQLWLVDLVTSGGTRMKDAGGYDTHLRGDNRVARVCRDARFRLANTPLHLQRIPRRTAEEWAEINRANMSQ